jgi:hypothetical protein
MDLTVHQQHALRRETSQATVAGPPCAGGIRDAYGETNGAALVLAAP